MTDESIKPTQIIDAEMLDRLREQVYTQVLAELSNKEEVDRQRKIAEREKNKKTRVEYLEQMRASSEPWVEVVAMEPDPELGIRAELEWNDAFIIYLKSQGITGTDDDQMIQQYVILLFRDMVEGLAEDEGVSSDFT